MQKQITIRLRPSEAANEQLITENISLALGTSKESVTGFRIDRKSIDARSRQPWITLTVKVFIDEPFNVGEPDKIVFKDVRHAERKVIIVGSGPAGIFAALHLMQNGIKPILLERGKEVRKRRRDLATLNREGTVNTESNYCFGEGGAGTYSDGKLYTRSNKRGDINRILNLFVQYGAKEHILYEAHPHIGTNKLPQIITAIRKAIIDHGGEFMFDSKVEDLVINKQEITGVRTSDGNVFKGDAVILATGHSARDIFHLLDYKKIEIEAKAFALGVRVEHPQSLIDSIQYKCALNGDLPPASYSLVEQVHGNGVFSFCMCPGGIIAPAVTGSGEVVVNGWSPSKRNNPYANSGIVVTITDDHLSLDKDFNKYLSAKGVALSSPLRMMYFQEMVEMNAYRAGGGNLVAPAQRLVDFCENKTSLNLPGCSYLPGISSCNLDQTLPTFVHRCLQNAFKSFGNKMKGYYTNDAVLVATESRTSSPVRIPRDNKTLQHPQIKNLYPCGEGAGYAGGIVSAAMDGERVATVIEKVFG